MQLSDEEKRELAEIYERAAEYLEQDGWIQHDAGGDNGPNCFLGATARACGTLHGTLDYYALSSEFAEGALELDHREYRPIISWNDDPTRTADEVINTLHALANKLR